MVQSGLKREPKTPRPAPLNTTHTPSTDHRTPGPQTSGRPRPGQEDHHHPEAGAFCQEKEKEFYARHVGRGSAGRL